MILLRLLLEGFAYIIFILCLWNQTNNFTIIDAQLELCQLNCNSSDRLVGPTKMIQTRPHPYSVASFPTKTEGFCQLGCTLFYNEVPKNTTCIRLCDYFYRYRITNNYNDLAEEAKLECKDGCQIALQVCQAGYYCNRGVMLPCPPGTYREPVSDVSILALNKATECTKCPFGRYSAISKRKSADECSKCPLGTYANVTGSIKQSDCLRCPAGENAEEEGMRLCTKITDNSVGMTIAGIDYYSNDVDYYRETIPYIGRW